MQSKLTALFLPARRYPAVRINGDHYADHINVLAVALSAHYSDSSLHEAKVTPPKSLDCIMRSTFGSGRWNRAAASAIGMVFLVASIGLLGLQFFIAASSKSDPPAPQQALREVVKLWSKQSLPPSTKFDVRAPIGLTDLGCRYWALDFLSQSCFGLIVYVDEPLNSGTRHSLASSITRPCDYLRLNFGSASLDSNIREALRCRTEVQSSYRLTVSFQTVARIIDPNGHITNTFEEIDRLTVTGSY